MRVDSHNTELGYEVAATIPYAYALFLKGELTETVSATGSGPLYFFSPRHTINPNGRDFAHTAAAAKEIPNMWIHKPRLDKKNWVPPPYKEYFGHRAIRFSKPTVVIYNRLNLEWGRPPVNFFDLPTLRSMFEMLCPQYDVVYFNIRGQEDMEDNAHSIPFGDYEMIRSEFPQVHIIHDLVEKHGGDYNDVQLRVFSGCEKFVTMNGGPCMLASMFGGENIIYTRECKELMTSINSFYNWYQDFGGAHVRVVNSYEHLLTTIDTAWVRKDPLINILVRCHQRPKALKRLWDSIQSQSYKNVRVIACYDDQDTWAYLHTMPFEKMEVRPIDKPNEPMYGNDYRGFAPYNLYLNQMAERVQHGYIMYLDDDDWIVDGALELVVKNLREDRATIWKALARNGMSIPEEPHWGKVVAGNISGIAFAFHSSQLPFVQWEPWRRGDYRVIKKLHNLRGAIWLNATLSVMGTRIDGRKKLDIPAGKQYIKNSADAINKAAKQLVAKRAAEKAGPNGRPLPLRSRWPTTSPRSRPT